MSYRRPATPQGPRSLPASNTPPQVKTFVVDQKAAPHNGDGLPELQFPDPVNGEMIGGQVAAVRMTVRYPHTCYPWARRQGKTRFYQFTLQTLATITSGAFYSGICYPDHTSAAKVADVFRQSWGGMVKDFKINDKDQDRWIDIHPLRPPEGPPPTWFTPRLAEKWKRCQREPNTSFRTYFWGAQFPHATKIQGFPHPFHFIGFDEAQGQDPRVYPIVRPMLRDVQGHEVFTGTPWADSIGNVQFEDYWDLAGTTEARHDGWFRMRVPDGANPHVPKTDLASARRSMSEDEIRQTLFAEFLQNRGAVFSNLNAILCLPFLPDGHEGLGWIRDLLLKFPIPSLKCWVNQPRPIPGHIYGLSMDWARSITGDASALTVMDFTLGEQAALFRWRGEEFPEQMEWVLAVQKHYAATQCHSDANGLGMAMSDFMRRRNSLGFVGHRFTSQNKHPLYVRQGQVLFRESAVKLIRCEYQFGEFKAYAMEESETFGSEKTVKYGAPEGRHDDSVSAFLMLAPTLAVLGRQDAVPVESDVPKPTFNEDRRTTFERFYAGMPSPFDAQDREEGGWDAVTLPPKYR